jgi:hypothetical protein
MASTGHRGDSGHCGIRKYQWSCIFQAAEESTSEPYRSVHIFTAGMHYQLNDIRVAMACKVKTLPRVGFACKLHNIWYFFEYLVAMSIFGIRPGSWLVD